MHKGHQHMSCSRRSGYPLLILPAVLLGVLGMIAEGISPAMWGQQIAVWTILSVITWLLPKPGKCLPAVVCCAALAALAATLLGAGAQGVRRWLDLGIFNINAAMLLLPLLLAALYGAKYSQLFLLGAAAVLCLQPDLSQLTALSAASLPLLWARRKERIPSLIAVILLPLLIFFCAGRPVSVEPVSYCENILAALSAISPLLTAAGVAALAVVPAYFFLQYRRHQSLPALSLSLYYAASLLFVLTGEYPVAFMSFGLSPIAGYFLLPLCGISMSDGNSASGV